MARVPRGFVLAFNVGLVVLFVAATMASAQWITVRAGDLVLRIEGQISPQTYPRDEYAPASFRTRGHIDLVDGSHPPALREAIVYIDKNGRFDAVGLPACSAGQLEARDTRTARRVCGDAIIGTGNGSALISFPEQRPIPVDSPITIFNGGVKGRKTTIYLHAFITVPTPAAIVTPFVFERVDQGRYGMRGVAHVPRIAGGSGSITDFDFKVKRLYRHEGRRKSFDLTKCPTGVIWAKGSAVFMDEVRDGVDDGETTEVSASIRLPCTPKG
jgi:hypothetical protein